MQGASGSLAYTPYSPYNLSNFSDPLLIHGVYGNLVDFGRLNYSRVESPQQYP